MPHLDEGTLQAYLDGGRSGQTAEERGAVELHVAGCSACAATLEALASTDRGAADLLGTSSVAGAPPFEAIRRRAEKPAPAKAFPRRRSWAATGWAASIMVAIGAGWLANDLSRREPALVTSPAEAGPAAPVPATADPDPAAARVAAEDAGDAGEGQDAAPSAPSASRLDAELADATVAAPEAEQPEPSPPARAEPAPPTPESAPAPAGLEEGATRGLRPPAADEAGRSSAADRDASPAAAEARRPSGRSQLADAPISTSWEPMESELLAATAGFPPLQVPGLAVLSRAVRETARGSQVRIVQALDDGSRLTLLQAVGAPPEEPSPAGSASVSVRVGEVWVLAHAPRTEAQLRDLVDRLSAPRPPERRPHL